MIFTKEDVVALRKRYEQAVKSNEERFTFETKQTGDTIEGVVMQTSYAGYLVEHLESNHQ